TIVLADYSSTAEVYQKLIGISEINKKADIINLSIKSDNPAYAKKIISSVINSYNQSGIKQQREKGLTTVRFLDERLTDLFADLQNQEKIMEQFKRDHNLSHVEADAALAIGRSAEYQEKLLGAELSLEMMKLVKGFITDPANNKSFIPSVGSSSGAAVQDAINGYNSMITQRMQLSQAAKSDNLALQQLDLNIDALRTNINITLDRSIETAEVQLADLRREAGRAKNLKGMIPQTEREYIDLERRQEMLQKLYLYLLQQREEKALSTANLQPRGVIVDEAYILAAPLKLSPVKATVIFLFLGLIIPAGFLFLRERMRKNICSANEVKAMCDSIPVLAESSNKSWCAELASAAKYMLGVVDGKCVMVTSPGNDPNTAQTAAELSNRLSAGGNKVLLIDTNTCSDSLGKALGIKSQPGLNEYLSGLCQLSDAIQHKSGIDIIASGGKAPNHSELLSTKRMADLMNLSAESYDYIVVTTPEMLANADSSIISEYAAATVIVVTENVTSITDIKTATSKINTGICHSTGIMYFNA
ncbi:MAG: hypothetical protein K2M76_04130, partial [Muribaculaceae bacterium]|nr:hypothetical protein [Muribaculaceae bacterium]